MDTDLIESFARGNVQIFVGAGLSHGIYPSANTFCTKLLDDDIYVDGKKTSVRTLLKATDIQLEDAAEFYELYKRPEALMAQIRREFNVARGPNILHQHLWQLPHVRWIYTTNYDCLIEDAVRSPHRAPLIVTTDSNKDQPFDRRIIFKPHGCARTSRKRDEFVISRNDYLNYSNRHPLETLKTLYDLSTKVFLFLGYSLRDLNMRHIIAEAHRLGNMRSYAVIKGALGPEARYWMNLGVTLVDLDAEEFFQQVFNEFPPDTSEFGIKVDERVEDKESIAIKAIERIEAEIRGSGSINVILDAGSTTLFVAKAIAAAIESGTIRDSSIKCYTNSPANVTALLDEMQLRGRKLEVVSIGGPLRHETRAFTPERLCAVSQLQAARVNDRRTIAFLGVTSVDKAGLKTKTEDEVPIKSVFIEMANQVYVLADHSKTHKLSESHVFAEWQRDKMSIITDRVENPEMIALNNVVSKIW